ncbi:ABC transporter ATP-binding protein [Epilithonimonas sp.]|uniref:ABC transporter ATP-binding protein n=1 Tax=Epilithonimonas sp. TaxID=2894511 RepID=UPI0028B04BD3|nr:ABC transporter ATP-binding protein [Epilithonimonas sp.]
MKPIALKAEDISKQYRLGQVGTGTLSHDLNRFWHQIRGKEDPYLKIGETNDRSQKGMSEYVWSLKDINFEIEQGDAVGIIGKNGAGKSTLLKLLSKVTKPTTGKIFTNGRIASLLEVGTGFHPEMTGRENVFLNGAILGMTRKEIARKFDEIVDFSGVERYIDTPVKRYSSGMYVRLAFAVAAHLESEILIVDEVLAVGDNEFQKKCLGKMDQVNQGEGRTVLFVSHNMGVVNSLCKNSILLKSGQINSVGPTSKVIQDYLKVNESGIGEVTDYSIVTNKIAKIRALRILNQNNETTSDIENSKQNFMEIEFEIFEPNKGYDVSFMIEHLEYGPIFRSCFKDVFPQEHHNHLFEKGLHKYRIPLPMDYLREGTYIANATIVIPKVKGLDDTQKDLQFTILDTCSPVLITGEGRVGSIMPILEWSKID